MKRPREEIGDAPDARCLRLTVAEKCPLVLRLEISIAPFATPSLLLQDRNIPPRVIQPSNQMGRNKHVANLHWRCPTKPVPVESRLRESRRKQSYWLARASVLYTRVFTFDDMMTPHSRSCQRRKLYSTSVLVLIMGNDSFHLMTQMKSTHDLVATPLFWHIRLTTLGHHNPKGQSGRQCRR